VQLHEPARQREADAEPSVLAPGPLLLLAERLEDERGELGRDARPVVLDPHHRGVRLARDGDTDVPAGSPELHRVPQELAQRLEKTGAVQGDGQRRRQRSPLQADVALGRRLGQRLERGPDHRAEVFRAPVENQAPLAEPHEVEQVLDQTHLEPHVPLDDVGSLLHAGPVGILPDDLRPGQDGRQRCPQLV
jgi:hypothetical protein